MKLRMKIAALGIALTLFAVQNHVNAAPSSHGSTDTEASQTVEKKVEPIKHAAKKLARSIFHPTG
ncbi:hypothetical protein [Salinithrix halophila]|uniref:hypothetical protein n=1 Tax=Salinithrix halophila TaxID=1485204 RepID=UPI0036D363F1